MSRTGPGSPTLKQGLNLIQNLTAMEARVPRLMTPGLVGMPPTLMRALFAGGQYVDDRIEIRGTEEMMKTTFKNKENQRVPLKKPSRRGTGKD